MKWSYDPKVDAADIIISPRICNITTLDLLGAHVLLDIDEAGNVVSIEILGPRVDGKGGLASLADLGEYLREEPNQ